MLQPKPWEKTMTGRPLPVAGAETRTWRSVPRSGAGITIGLADTTSRSVMVGLPSEVGFEVGVPGAPCRSVKRRPALPDGGCHDGVKRNAVPVTTIRNHVPLCKGDHRGATRRRTKDKRSNHADVDRATPCRHCDR